MNSSLFVIINKYLFGKIKVYIDLKVKKCDEFVIEAWIHHLKGSRSRTRLQGIVKLENFATKLRRQVPDIQSHGTPVQFRHRDQFFENGNTRYGGKCS